MINKATIKAVLRPIWRKFYKHYAKANIRLKTFEVEISKLLCGGENGIRAARYAEISNSFLRPSTSVLEGPHVKFLQQYAQIGDKILDDDIFTNTAYYKNAYECMQLTGSYFYDRPEKLKILAQRFIAQHNGEMLNVSPQPGQSGSGQPVWVRKIRASACYEVIDGNHRIARAIMRGEKHISVLIYEPEAVYTPLQQLLLDSLWINKQKWLYQPVDSPELKDEWTLVRNCNDRLQMMQNFLQSITIEKTYLDIGSSYGWFVKKFADLGFAAFGMERDPVGIQVGIKTYGVIQGQIMHTDIALGLENLVASNKKYDVVSFLSILHHFVLKKSSISAEEIMKLIDKITGQVLFIDTGEAHESAFENALSGWSPEFIKQWIKQNTSFKEIIPLGIDRDKKHPFTGYYSRTLFACIR